MANEKHDPWALLRDVRGLLAYHWSRIGSAEVSLILKRIDEILPENQPEAKAEAEAKIEHMINKYAKRLR